MLERRLLRDLGYLFGADGSSFSDDGRLFCTNGDLLFTEGKSFGAEGILQNKSPELMTLFRLQIVSCVKRQNWAFEKNPLTHPVSFAH